MCVSALVCEGSVQGRGESLCSYALLYPMHSPILTWMHSLSFEKVSYGEGGELPSALYTALA